MGEFLRLHGDGVDLALPSGAFGDELGEVGQLAACRDEAVVNGVVAFEEGGGDAAAEADDLFGVGAFGVAGDEVLVVVVGEVGGGDLFDNEGEVFALGGEAFGGALEGFEFGVDLLEGAPALAVGVELLGGAAEGVEEVALEVGGEEGLVVVGAVDVDEVFAEAFEELGGGGGGVDLAAAVALEGEGAADDELVVFAEGEAAFFEDGVEGLGIGVFDLEGAFDGGFGFAAADEAFVGAFAEEEAEGAHEDGFARAGFAGDDVEAVSELGFGGVNDGEVADCEVAEHGCLQVGVRGEALGLVVDFELGAHVALEDLLRGFSEVYDDEAVDDGAEVGVEVEADEAPGELHVLHDEDGEAFAVGLDLHDELGDGVEIFEVVGVFGESPLGAARGLGRDARGDDFGEFGFPADVAQALDHHAAGGFAVFVGDGDGAEEGAVFLLAGDKEGDTFPEEGKGGEGALVFAAYEGAAHFHDGTDGVDEALVEFEEGAGVEAFDFVGGDDFVSEAEAVAADDFGLLCIPEEEVPVVGVEVVEVDFVAGAFANEAEGDFAQAANLAQEVGDL